MHIKPSSAVSTIKPYFFSDLGKRINQLRAEGKDVIRLDMGSPDLPPADFIIDALTENARKPNLHGYTLGGGTADFRKALAAYYRRRFEVDLDPASEVIDLIGSKEGLFVLNHVLLDRGDLVLVPNPAYGVYAGSARMIGAEVVSMPLLAENGFLPDLSAIPEKTAQKASVMWLNYPNNPTGATADLAFFEAVIDFARTYEIVVAHDAPYTDVGFDGYRAPSILEVPGAKDVAVEFNSFSKIYNMAGWRLGMALGNSQVVKLIETYKSQKDSALFTPIMNAGIAALEGDQTWIVERNHVYQQRRDIVLQAFEQAGFVADVPKAALYIWAKLPDNTNSIDFCTRLLDDTGVSLTPGVVFGACGEGYLRLSLVTPTERIREGMSRLIEWIQ
jgi:LL-diaminopimelate aminotransferase